MQKFVWNIVWIHISLQTLVSSLVKMQTRLIIHWTGTDCVQATAMWQIESHYTRFLSSEGGGCGDRVYCLTLSGQTPGVVKSRGANFESEN